MSGDAEIRTITQADRADSGAPRCCAFQTWTVDPPTEREIDRVVPEDAFGIARFPQSVRGVRDTVTPLGAWTDERTWLTAGHFVSPAALTLLLVEGTRVFVSGLDVQGAVVITAALVLYLVGAGPGHGAGLSSAGRGARRRRAAP